MNWKTFEQDGYSIQYPANWKLDQSGQKGTSFILASPLASKKGAFKNSIHLILQDISDYDLNLNNYVDVHIRSIKELIPNLQITESERIAEVSDEFHRLIYTGEQGASLLYFMQHFWVKDEMAYVLTFTCEHDKLQEIKEVGETVLNSFKFKQ